MTTIRLRRLLAAALLAAIAAPALATEAAFPSKPITLVVPAAPGGTTDLTARLLADPLAKLLGQSVIVDNRAGGNGNIGTVAVARAPADGHTLLVQYSGYQVGNPHLSKNVPWQGADFAAVALAMRAPNIVVVPVTLPVKTLKEFVDHAKANPGKVNYASSGVGSIQHIAGEMLNDVAGIDMVHVPYKGSGQVYPDLIGNQVQTHITSVPSAMPHIMNGKLRALAITGPSRVAALPDVPTAAEAGYPSLQLDSWFGVYAPAATPPAVIAKVSAAVKQVVESADFRAKAEAAGGSATYMDPKAFDAFTASELERWGRIIRKANISVD